jgi:signal peptidase I
MEKRKNKIISETVDIENSSEFNTDIVSENDDVEEFEIIDGEITFSDEGESQVVFSEEEVLTDDQLENISGKKKFYLTVYDLVSTVMGSFVIIALVFTFAFRLVGVDGESMTNTLQHGDWLLTYDKTEYEQGDIVVVTAETYFQKPLIKRVIAVGGQTVDIDYETATVYVDDVPLDEPYVKEDFLIEKSEYREFPYEVPDGYLFCMGDNRNGSSDSRTDLVGPIDERQILGKAFVRIMPFGEFDIYDYE